MLLLLFNKHGALINCTLTQRFQPEPMFILMTQKPNTRHQFKDLTGVNNVMWIIRLETTGPLFEILLTLWKFLNKWAQHRWNQSLPLDVNLGKFHPPPILTPQFLKTHINVILPPPSAFLNDCFPRNSLFPYPSLIPSPYKPTRVHYSNNTRWHIYLQSSLLLYPKLSSCFIFLRSKHRKAEYHAIFVVLYNETLKTSDIL